MLEAAALIGVVLAIVLFAIWAGQSGRQPPGAGRVGWLTRVALFLGLGGSLMSTNDDPDASGDSHGGSDYGGGDYGGGGGGGDGGE